MPSLYKALTFFILAGLLLLFSHPVFAQDLGPGPAGTPLMEYL